MGGGITSGHRTKFPQAKTSSMPKEKSDRAIARDHDDDKRAVIAVSLTKRLSKIARSESGKIARAAVKSRNRSSRATR